MHNELNNTRAACDQIAREKVTSRLQIMKKKCPGMRMIK